jgi:hypothetical protein
MWVICAYDSRVRDLDGDRVISRVRLAEEGSRGRQLGEALPVDSQACG